MTNNNFDEKHFFDNYTSFYTTGTTGTRPSKLNNRYLAMIHNNKKIIEGSSILDLASHDGRWSFAAIKTGAKRVYGIEAVESLVSRSVENMKKYGITSEKYSFVVGDIFEQLKKLTPKEFDVVFCFGVFYHTVDQMLLIREIKRLQPRYLILDTEVTLSNDPIIRIRKETPYLSDPLSPDSKFIVGRPSKRGIEMMLESVGFDYSYYDWKNSGIKDWKPLEIYSSKKSILLKKAARYALSMLIHSKDKKKISRQDLVRYATTKRVTLVARNLTLPD